MQSHTAFQDVKLCMLDCRHSCELQPAGGGLVHTELQLGTLNGLLHPADAAEVLGCSSLCMIQLLQSWLLLPCDRALGNGEC